MGRKWNNIKEKKAEKDKNTSRIYAKFGKEIYVAAKSGEPDRKVKPSIASNFRTREDIFSA